jgi:methyl-accepting chemotaxis protein
MSQSLVSSESVFDKTRLYRKAVFMAFSAVLASAGIIAYYDQNVSSVLSSGAAAELEVAALTLMPYLIAAVIATITAIGVMTILPSTRVAEPAEEIVHRLRDIGDGDLTTRVRLEADDPLKEVGIAFNTAASSIGDRVAHWKIVNRQQWGVLCRIRQAVELDDREEALRFIAEMEQNWDRIAEIEQQLTC